MIDLIVPTLDAEAALEGADKAAFLAGVDVDLNVIEDTEGLGYTRTVNRGLGNRPACILVDDCEVERNWLATLWAEMQRHKPLNVHFAGPSGPCRTQPQNSGRRGDNRRPRIVSHLAGFCLLMSAEAAAMGLDERYTHYASDVDLQWRAAQEHGASSLWVPGVYVNHQLHDPRRDWWEKDQRLLKEIWR